MSITQFLGGASGAFPLVNQLSESTADGQPDENARLNCVAASIAAALEYLTGRKYNGDELKDAVYGQGYTGAMSAAHFIAYCATLGVRLWPVSADQAGLVAAIHNAVSAGQPCLVTMPSQWGTAPANPVSPSGYTHVGVACGAGAGEVRVMNPWGGFYQDESDAWWQARLCFGQVWPLEKVSASVATVPSGWRDDGTLLTAPNGVQCDLGFRTFVLNFPGGWPAWNWPLENESGVNPVEMSNPAMGGGTHQPFRATLLEWTASKGVFVAWVGQEYVTLRDALGKAQTAASDAQAQAQQAQSDLTAAQAQRDALSAQLASAQTTITQLQQEIATLKTNPPTQPAPLTPAQQAADALVVAIKNAIA